MRYYSELPARVNKADATELARLARLYPHNARLQTLVAQALRNLPDRPKPLFTPVPSTQPNPDTHCTSCGEVLSEYHHCWQCHYPPMDPAQHIKKPELACSFYQAKRISTLLAQPFDPAAPSPTTSQLKELFRTNLPPGWVWVDNGQGHGHAHSGGDLGLAEWTGELLSSPTLAGMRNEAMQYASWLIKLLEHTKPHLAKPLGLPRGVTNRKDRKKSAAAAPYCNGQCGICSCIPSPPTATATPSK